MSTTTSVVIVESETESRPVVDAPTRASSEHDSLAFQPSSRHFPSSLSDFSEDAKDLILNQPTRSQSFVDNRQWALSAPACRSTCLGVQRHVSQRAIPDDSALRSYGISKDQVSVGRLEGRDPIRKRSGGLLTALKDNVPSMWKSVT